MRTGPATLNVLSLWGKSSGFDVPYPLVAHLLDTAAVASSLLERSPHRPALQALTGLEEPEPLVAALCGLHDLGKATPAFQYMAAAQAGCDAAVRDQETPVAHGTRHDASTRMTLPDALSRAGFEIADLQQLEGLGGTSCALGGHHGRFAALDPELEIHYRDELLEEHHDVGVGHWEDLRAELTRLVLKCTGASTSKLAGDLRSLISLYGLAVISDWMASSSEFIESCDRPASPDDLEEFYVAKRVEAERVVEQHQLRPVTWEPKTSFFDAFGFAPRPLQRDLDEHLQAVPKEPGIITIAAPMGVGKTEAALRSVEQLGATGVYFALPTMATADAMFSRLVEFAAQRSPADTTVSLAHSKAMLSDAYAGLPLPGTQRSDDSPEGRAVASRWMRGSKRNLLAQLSAGTIDQLLAGVLPMKHSMLRIWALSSKAVIIDEAHSLTDFSQKLTERFLEWCGFFHIPVVVLSATMPQNVSVALTDAWCRGAGLPEPHQPVGYPGWLHVALSGTVFSGTVPTDDITWNVDLVPCPVIEKRLGPNVVAGTLHAIETGGCGLVVTNTVADAQHLTEDLRGWADEHDVELLCLHSRMLHSHRRDLTDDIVSRVGPAAKRRPARLVVIATQIVEQSLDVDFDLVVSALAPIAPLLQRAGRGHRHVRDRSSLPATLQTPRLVVLDPYSGAAPEVPFGWTFVYPKAYLTRTRQLLEGRPTISIPSDVQPLVDDVYGTLDEVHTDDAMVQLLDKQWAERSIASRILTPAPANISNLGELSTDPGDPDLIVSTRLGAASLTLLPVRERPDGSLETLTGIGLPDTPTITDIRALLDATVPVRLTKATYEWNNDHGATDRPDSWADVAYLQDLAVIRTVPAPGPNPHFDLNGLHDYDPQLGWRKLS